MRKIIIATLTALLTILGTNNLVSAETIYTSMPDQNDDYYQPFYDSLKKFNYDFSRKMNKGDSFSVLKFYYPDIWLRDVAPVVTTKMVKFKYSPNYLKKCDSRYLNNHFKKFLKGRYKYSQSSLVLDGGNAQWDGDQTVVLTKKVFQDNPDWTKTEITSELKDKLKVKRVVYISIEPGDVLGHSDGMVKFISPNKMFINDFSYEPGFLQKIERQIKKQIPEMKFIVLPSAYTSKGQYDSKIASAKGLYINMLETNHAIYFPMYGLKQDHTVLKMVQAQTNKPVVPVKVGNISVLGGSLHCLTWNVPNKFKD